MRIRLRNLKKAFNDKTVLDIDSLELETGKIYAVLGPNGSGKTTMLRVLANLERADEGEVSYGDKPVFPKDTVAYLAQRPYLFDISVYKNVVLGIKNKENIRSEAVNALKQVGMESFVDRRARSLSGGEAQKAALARTLVLGRSLVFLDEPTSAVDISSIKMVEEYIRYVNNSDKSTIVFTTHNPSQALRLAHEIIVLWNGRIVEKGIPIQILESPKTEEIKEFLKNWRI